MLDGGHIMQEQVMPTAPDPLMDPWHGGAESSMIGEQFPVMAGMPPPDGFIDPMLQSDLSDDPHGIKRPWTDMSGMEYLSLPTSIPKQGLDMSVFGVFKGKGKGKDKGGFFPPLQAPKLVPPNAFHMGPRTPQPCNAYPPIAENQGCTLAPLQAPGARPPFTGPTGCGSLNPPFTSPMGLAGGFRPMAPPPQDLNMGLEAQFCGQGAMEAQAILPPLSKNRTIY